MTNSTNIFNVDINNFLPAFGIIALLFICYLHCCYLRKKCNQNFPLSSLDSLDQSSLETSPSDQSSLNQLSLNHSFISNVKEEKYTQNSQDNHIENDQDPPCYNDVIN